MICIAICQMTPSDANGCEGVNIERWALCRLTVRCNSRENRWKYSQGCVDSQFSAKHGHPIEPSWLLPVPFCHLHVSIPSNQPPLSPNHCFILKNGDLPRFSSSIVFLSTSSSRSHERNKNGPLLCSRFLS